MSTWCLPAFDKQVINGSLCQVGGPPVIETVRANDQVQKTLEGLNKCVLVLWLWEETYVLKVLGSKLSTAYWMDIFSQIFVVKIVLMFVWEDENKYKGGWGWPIFF